MTVRAGQLSVTMRTATAPPGVRTGGGTGTRPARRPDATARRDRSTRPLDAPAQREPAAAPAPSAASVAALAVAPPSALSAAA